MIKGGSPTDDYSNSTAFNIWPNFDNNSKAYQLDAKNMTVTYGPNEVKGQWASGAIFLNQDGNGLESDSFDFLYASDYGKTFDNTQAIFGLARPGEKFKINADATPDNGRKLFLDSWSATDTGNNKIFSTRFSSDHFSWIDFG